MLKPHINDKVIPFKFDERERWNKEPLPSHEVIAIIVGSTGSGKTSSLLHLIPNIAPKYVKSVIIMSRIEGNKIFDAIKNWCESKNISYDFTADINESMDLLENRINKKENEEDQIIAVFDDFNNASKSDKNDKFNQVSIEMVTKGRNYGVNSLYIIQQYQSLPTVIRANANLMILFNINDRHARYACAKDFTTLTGTDDETFYELMKMIKTKHSYIFATADGIYMYIHNKMNRLMKVEIEE